MVFNIKISQIKINQLRSFSNILIQVEQKLREKTKKLWDFNKISETNIKNTYNPNELYLILINKEKAGTIILQEKDILFWPEFERDENAIYIHKFSLLPRFAGRGLSKEVLLAVQKKAEEDGRHFLRLDCNKDMNKICELYEDFGFKEIDSRFIEGKEVVRYEKKLTPYLEIYNKSGFSIKKASGMYLFNDRGKFLDLLSGVNTNLFGFNNKKINNVAKRQIDKYIHISNYHDSSAQVYLLNKLRAVTNLDNFLLLNSSSEANEALLTILSNRQNPNKKKIITFGGSFFGRTYGCRKLNMGGRYENLDITSIPVNDLAALKQALNGEVLAIYLELIQGHGGIVALKKEIIEFIIEAKEKFDIKLVIDETLTGLGRCNSIFLYKEYNLSPDALIIGKAIGGGFPLAILGINSSISKWAHKGVYGSTLGGNSVACSCGSFILDEIQKKLIRFNENADYLNNKLGGLCKKFKLYLKGKGFFLGIEFGTESEARIFYQTALKNNIFFDIVGKKTVRIMLPINVSKKEIDVVASKLNNLLRIYKK